MARADDTELIDRFEEFYRSYYRNEIADLAQKYPTDRKSLYIDWSDLARFDADLADDFRTKPQQLRQYAEEALRLYDLPVDVSLGQAHVRVTGLSETTDIRAIRADHRGSLLTVQGIVRKATDVRPKVTTAAFECQRCGTLTRIPQDTGEFQEPHECQGCERQGPFKINYDQSEFVDAQTLRVQESPEGLRGGETPQSIDVTIEDDITGEVTAGDHVSVTGVLKLEQQGSEREQSPMFDVYMQGLSVEVEDEEFKEMDISDEDRKEIIELSNEPDIYEQIQESIAPSIFGYEREKLAMALQLFSGVTKHLPDGSRTRGDLHMLLIGDPGTGKCQKGDESVVLADGRRRELGPLVEAHLDDPVEIDDGYYQETDIGVLTTDGEDVKPGRATKVWKREAPEQMYRIRTASGRELEVTPSHPLFVQRDGQLSPVVASDLSDGDFLATPRQLPNEGDDRLDVEYERATRGVTDSLDCPDELTTELARLLGYVVGGGSIGGPPSNRSLRIVDADEEIREDIVSILEQLGLRYRISDKEGTDARELLCSSLELSRLLADLEPAILDGSAQQRVPDVLFRASRSNKREFLRAYLDDEGSVSARQRELTVASRSKELLAGVRALLLGLGIDSQLHPRNGGSYRLRVSGRDFERYVSEVGFVTGRKTTAADAFDGTTGNTNTDVIPNVGGILRRTRETLTLSQFDCGLPRSTYQHYEHGDRSPSRARLRVITSRFEDRLDRLAALRERVAAGDPAALREARETLSVSQAALAAGTDVTQTAANSSERNDAVPDGGTLDEMAGVVLDGLDEALAAEADVQRLRALVTSDIAWDPIESIAVVEPDYEWVYDLEVAETHTYLSEGVVSHNSALLQYVDNIAPRAVYSSGKGTTSAGLCVTGDTLVHTADGFEEIRSLVTESLPDSVETETSVEREIPVMTFDRESGTVECQQSSHVWRMPERPCRRIETSHGKSLEASTNTPVLTCAEGALEWKSISDVSTGDYVAVPAYDETAMRDRTAVETREFLEFTEEKVTLDEDSLQRVRAGLRERFGTLRDGAAQLELSEDFIYDSLSNRHVPLEKLDRILDAIDRSREDVSFERVMLRHGDSITIPETFDEELMYLLGLVFGDGDIRFDRRDENRGCVRISNGDVDLLRRAADIVERAFDKHVRIEHQEQKVPCIRIHSATIARLFSNAGMETPKDSLSLHPKLTTAAHADAFLRGFMDADGSVSVRDNGGSSVLFSTISETLARQLQLMFESYGIRSRRRERDRRGKYERADGYVIETNHVQHFVEMHGKDIDTYADVIGFEAAAKRDQLRQIAGETERRPEPIPVGSALATADGVAGQFHNNVVRGDNPGRKRARKLLDELDFGSSAPELTEVVDADLVWDEVTTAVDTGLKEVFDLTVPETHNFVGNGLVTHNTAAAVRDDFGEGQQWSLEAGALVLADGGIAAIDELDKMSSEDQSAMHEALEQQSVSVNKAGINATLKARCSLLGAANPTMGRFDQYESIGEQIDLAPPLISRFDLIFTVTDEPDEEEDTQLAEHILQTNYAGELHTHRTNSNQSNYSSEEVDRVTDEVAPTIEPELLRKYIAFARRNCFPTMTEEAKDEIQEFYVDLRAEGTGEDAPVPVTARKLEALVRLAEASARIRLSDTVELADAERAVDIAHYCLREIGMDPETEEYDADIIETGTTKSQRDRVRNLLDIVEEIETEYDEGAPVDVVIERAEEVGIEPSKAEHEIESLKQKGEVYQPSTDHLRTT